MLEILIGLGIMVGFGYASFKIGRFIVRMGGDDINELEWDHKILISIGGGAAILLNGLVVGIAYMLGNSIIS